MTLDILVPVLSRPQNVTPLMKSIAANTTVPYEVHFLCSPGDMEEIGACEQESAVVHVMDWPAGPGDYSKKMNHGFRVTSQPLVLLAADDLDFQPGWDTLALAAAEETGAGVIGLNDCSNPQVQKGLFSTHPLVRRSYIDEHGGTFDNEPGVVVYEGYDHNMPDVELATVAKSRNQWVFVKDAKVCHKHPSWVTAPDDATYQKGRAHFHEDGRLFVKRQRQWGRQARTARRR